jgi:hypothetical protein
VTTSLATKVDKVTGKELSTNDYTTAEKTKLAAITGTNTGDQDLSAYATTAQVATKANASDVTTSLATKVDKVTGKELSTNDYTTAEKTKLAAITGTNTGDQVNITGNAGTATKLQSSVTINGIAFDGSANITVPAGVPYTGATQAVNLGAYDLSVNGITVGRGKMADGDNKNTAVGQSALSNNTGTSNTAIGNNALLTNTSGAANTAIGASALQFNVSGGSNTAVGLDALRTNVGSQNTAVGRDALRGSGTGSTNNTAIGYNALKSTTSSGNTIGGLSGTGNTAVGSGAGSGITTGSNNITVGGGDGIVTGSNNTLIGVNARVSTSSFSNATVIGYNAVAQGDNSTAIGNGAIAAANTIQLGSPSVTDVKTSGTITAAGMGLGVSAPNASAALEVNSTTKGFLPPRMTTLERDAIATPAAGLTVWNTTNTQLEVFDGSDWVNMLGNKGPNLKVGDSYGGGIIAHIFTKGETGYVAKEIHGLIAATSDQSTGIQWRNGTNSTTGATGQQIGTGLANTNTIITSQGPTATSYAAGIARAHNGGGFTDWFLPSRYELATLYLNRVAIGGFSTNSYHSSSEVNSTNNYMQDFNNGYPASGVKSFAASVRAVRTF